MDKVQNNTTEGFKITGNWEKQSKTLREKYPSLTDSDLKFEPGKEKELISRVSSRLNKKEEEVTNILKKDLEIKS